LNAVQLVIQEKETCASGHVSGGGGGAVNAKSGIGLFIQLEKRKFQRFCLQRRFPILNIRTGECGRSCRGTQKMRKSRDGKSKLGRKKKAREPGDRRRGWRRKNSLMVKISHSEVANVLAKVEKRRIGRES